MISLDTAVKWVKAWRDMRDFSGSDFKATLIPMADANDIIAETNAVDIRGYNGYDADTRRFKLILVGVDQNGRDILSAANPGSQEGSMIYDLTLPCPNTCNVESPIFMATL